MLTYCRVLGNDGCYAGAASLAHPMGSEYRQERKAQCPGGDEYGYIVGCSHDISLPDPSLIQQFSAGITSFVKIYAIQDSGNTDIGEYPHIFGSKLD